MHTCRLRDDHFEIGYYGPNAEWVVISTRDTQRAAIRLVSALNGGTNLETEEMFETQVITGFQSNFSKEAIDKAIEEFARDGGRINPNKTIVFDNISQFLNAGGKLTGEESPKSPEELGLIVGESPEDFERTDIKSSNLDLLETLEQIHKLLYDMNEEQGGWKGWFGRPWVYHEIDLRTRAYMHIPRIARLIKELKDGAKSPG